MVLAIQDTTDLDFTSCPATRGLGFIHQGPHQGIKVHSCIAVSGDGEPLGLLHQHHWTRTERRGKRRRPRPKKRVNAGLIAPKRRQRESVRI